LLVELPSRFSFSAASWPLRDGGQEDHVTGKALYGRALQAIHLLVHSTGLKLCGAGEWLLEKHGTKTRRSWRKLHIGMDAETGQMVAAALTANDVDDGS
jgi:hypothetical protein